MFDQKECLFTKKNVSLLKMCRKLEHILSVFENMISLGHN